MGRGRGHALSAEAADVIIANIGMRSPARAAPLPPSPRLRAPEPAQASRTTLLNRGHWRSLELLEKTPAVLDTLARYEEAIGHPVYLRPTSQGLTVMSLDPATPAMVGVGANGDCCINVLPPSTNAVASAALAYRAKVAAMSRDSAEERHVIARIRSALANGLKLEDGLLFLHQEWRFPNQDKLDILAFDSRAGCLVVIEAKSTKNAALHERDAKGRTASEQAASYAAQLLAHAAECTPYFQRLAVALGRIYGAAQLTVDIDGAALPRCELWWPNGSAPASSGKALRAAASVDEPGDVACVAETVVHFPTASVDLTFVAGDAPWQSELRRRQSRWREARGYPVGLHDGRPLGSRLAMPDAEEKLWNYFTPAIGELVRREYLANASVPREQQKMYGYPRLFNDLLSSQPLAFNLFGELALDLARASAVARRLWPGRVDSVTRIELEWSPGRWNPRYLGNGTAADIAIFHTTPGGETGAIFIETKYHEDLRGKDHAIKPRYLEVAFHSFAFLNHSSLQSGMLQQLWLDHLLVLAVKQTDELASALFVLMYPEINEPCRDAAIAYREALDPKQPPTFEARTLEEVISAFDDEANAGLAAAFRERYLTPTG